MLNIIFLGTNHLTVRFFGFFKTDDDKNNGFFRFVTLSSIAGVGTFLLLLLPFYNKIWHYFTVKFGIFSQYIIWLLPTILCVSFLYLYIQFCLNFKRTAFPSLLEQLIKFVLPILAILYYNSYINLHVVSFGIFFTYLITLVLIILFIRHIGQLNWNSKRERPLLKSEINEMRSYTFYGFLMSIAWALSTRFDTIIVPTMINLSESSVYNIAWSIAGLISISADSLTQIATAVIADKWRTTDLKEIDIIYKKSSILLMSIGCFFLVGIAVCIQDLFSLMPNGYKYVGGIDVILILGVAKVIDMLTSVNNPIIQYSDKYKFNLYALGIYGLCNLVFSLLLIPHFGINGAAISVLISVIVFNLIKLIFIYYHWKMLPFSFSTIKILIISILAYSIAWFCPNFDNDIINIIWKGTIILIIFAFTMIFWKVSDEIDQLFIDIKMFIKKYL